MYVVELLEDVDDGLGRLFMFGGGKLVFVHRFSLERLPMLSQRPLTFSLLLFDIFR